MDLRNERELINTRHKLGQLQALYDAAERETEGDQELREIEQESLQRFINQLKEEIARFEAHHTANS
jgi:hypothetical protein